MARPRSDEKKNAIMAAAVRVIIAEGLSAPTALIARDAGVSNGTLFVYFKTKAELFNQLYLELKTGMASAAMEGFSSGADFRSQLFHVWSNWMAWAVSNPDKRRVLALLSSSGEITFETIAAGHRRMADIGALMEKCRGAGAMRDVPMPFAAAIMNSLAETTMDFMVQDPPNADKHCKSGFEAFWRVLN